MSKETSSKNEPSNERSSQTEAQINEPSNERSSESGTQGNQRGQNPMVPVVSPQNKCRVCGQTFSSQNELNDHSKKVHSIEPKEVAKEAGSVNKGNETSSTQSG